MRPHRWALKASDDPPIETTKQLFSTYAQALWIEPGRQLKRPTTPIVCSIGSSDPTAAAGALMDLQVYTQLRVRPVCVIAAVTAQNRRSVVGWAALAPRIIREQLECVWEEAAPNAVCIGLLPTRPVLETIRRFLLRLRRRPPIVVDPVIAASSGRRFLRASDVKALASLFSLATIITPNVMEAAELTGVTITSRADQEAAARTLAGHGCAALVTGGHLAGDTCTDVLARGDRVRCFSARRLRGRMRGSGGILAAAIAAHLARGATIEAAISNARKYVRRALIATS